jgi:hypothetical protein
LSKYLLPASTVIASEAKQSIARRKERIDRFVVSAQNCFAILSQGSSR